MLLWVLERELKCGSIILQGPQVSEVKNATAIGEEKIMELNSDGVAGK